MNRSLHSDSGLDIEDSNSLVPYLRERGLIPATGTPDVRKLEGGVSNRIVMVRHPGRAAFVVKQALAKLRTSIDWYSEPVRVRQEALGIKWLSGVAPEAITPLLFEDRDHNLIGIGAVAEPHRNLKTMLLAGEIDLSHIKQFGALLGTIHRASAAKSDDVSRIFDDRTFFETLRLEPYYRFAAEQRPKTAGFFAELIAGTLATRIAVVHGDYSPKNILVHDGRIVLLDHEVIHFGDPAFDIGFSLTHLLSKAHHVLDRRREFGRASEVYVESYLNSLGQVPWLAEVEARAARHTIGCLLARVVGRSPLEYLTVEERKRQCFIAEELALNPPQRLGRLIAIYLKKLNAPD